MVNTGEADKDKAGTGTDRHRDRAVVYEGV